MHHATWTLSARQICGQAVSLLLPGLGVIGWLAGVGTVDPLLLLQVLVRAGAERRSLHAIALLSRNLPSAETIRQSIMRLLPATVERFQPAIPVALQQLAYIMYKGFSVPASSYLLSCRKAERSGDILQAECRQVDGTWKSTRLDLNTCKENIFNNNGQLTCVKK